MIPNHPWYSEGSLSAHLCQNYYKDSRTAVPRSLRSPNDLIIFTKGVTKYDLSIVLHLKKNWHTFVPIQCHSGGEAISPEMMRHVLVPKGWKEFIYHKGCFFNVKSILEKGLVAGGTKARDGRQTVFFLEPLGQDDEEEYHDRLDVA